MTKIFAPAIAISTGILVLMGYFFPNKTLLGIRTAIVQWAVILAGVAVLVGIFNLLAVHLKKMQGKNKRKGYSFLLIISLIVTFVLGVFFGTNSAIMQTVFSAIILPVERSLLAIMAITLIYAGIRLLRYRNDLMAILFILTVIIIMAGSANLPFLSIPLAGSSLRPWLSRVLATSGARGILLGVALGTLLTGLRVLIGADRPYGGK